MIVVGYGLCLFVSFILFYFMLPALTVASLGFWFYLLCVVGLFCLCSAIFKDDSYVVSKLAVGFGIAIGVIIAIIILGALISSPIFRAKTYAGLINDNVKVKEISEYTSTIEDVPLMDKDTAELLASRTMGTLVDAVSQYTLGESVQINYQDRPVRVVPLEYDGFFKWMNNKSQGIPSYITVDMSNQKTEIHNLDKGIRYSPSGCFNDDLRRLLRFKYPTSLLSAPIFEIDENGSPYWVVSVLEHRVGLFGGTDVKGILIVDAITGEIEEYGMDEIPDMVDNAYPTDVLIDLYDYYGKYQGGFLNSIFGQKGVIKATDGYNYIPKNDDIYVYTGVTSVVSDESNIGFIFVNKRTKEYEYYEVSGAEEFSAMASAEGAVQNLGYTSTFPLLLQIEGQPTYCVSLKDAGGLVKMYGLVNMSQYQIVVTGDTMNECLVKYRAALKGNGQSVIEAESEEKYGVVEDIRTANIEGTTYFYIKVDNSPIYYAFSIVDNEEIVLVNVGDNVKFNITVGSNGNIVRAILQ